jgi:hypothetical protein
MTASRVLGSALAALHLIFITILASVIFVHQAAEAWLFATLLDLPVHYLSFPIIYLVPALHRTSIHPWTLEDWDFLFPLIWFGVLGTTQWFVIGWAFGRLLDSAKEQVNR